GLRDYFVERLREKLSLNRSTFLPTFSTIFAIVRSDLCPQPDQVVKSGAPPTIWSEIPFILALPIDLRDHKNYE
ncbi:MAG: hypothetical protein ABIQ93_04540, partial [Saprospiraceae bacterium]